jgi:mannose-6-phosphate isomerase-like protein (cupin superfamily)
LASGSTAAGANSNLESVSVNIQILGSADTAGLPPAPAVMAMARFTFDPGTELDNFEVPGPEVLVLESGSLVVDLRGETEDEGDVEEYLALLIPATPGKDQLSTPVPEVFRYAMLPGDRLFVPADNPHKIANTGKTPAVLLAGAVTPLAPARAEQAWPPAGIAQPVPGVGITIQPMSVGYNVEAALLTGDNTLSLERVIFATSRGDQSFTADSPQLWYIEAGSMRVTEILGGATVASPATTWQQPSAGAGKSTTAVFLRPGDALRLDAGSTVTFSSASSEPIAITAMQVAAAKQSPFPKHDH